MIRFLKDILKPAWPAVLALISMQSQAQTQLFRDTVVVRENGQALRNPWAGGLNFCEASQLDLDMDGKKDLVIYDKVCSSGGILRAFLNEGGAGQTIYKHAPYYQSQFPAVTDWAMFYDYNNDGRQDLFTYVTGGIAVYKNISTPGMLSFALVCPLIYSDYGMGGPPNYSNLYCNPVALPGVGDIDNDGDLDILTYSVFGIEIEYHKNMSMELYGHADSLSYKLVDNCWGDIYENNCEVALYQCPYQKIYENMTGTSVVKKVLHAGSCIMCYDRNGDGDQDLILGDISCSIVHYVENTGSPSNAHITDTTQLYPNYPAKGNTTPVRMNSFPCTYYLDVDNDGKKDLLASPNAIAGSENFNSLWFYKNMSSDNVVDFQIQQKNFLQETMIEVGEGAVPVLFDADSDGKQDLLVANTGYYTGITNISKIAWYKNTGTASVPSFSLMTRDYQNLSSQNIFAMFPTFGDLDGDGDQDLIIGDFNGGLTYFQNTALFGQPAVFNTPISNYFSIDVGNNATPQIFDVDKDGDLDLVIGNQTGKLTYYRNTGTPTNPNFVLQTANLGGINVQQYGYLTGYSVPFMYNDGGITKLLVGAEIGNIYLYDQIDGNLSGTFNRVDTNLYKINEGTRCVPFFADINNDGKRDLFLGNYAGGVGFFSSIPNTLGIKEYGVDASAMIQAYPNPVNDQLTISINSESLLLAQYSLFDALGNEVIRMENENKVNRVDVSGFASGLYFLQVRFFDEHHQVIGSATKKIMIQ